MTEKKKITVTLDNATIQTQEEAEERAAEIRENAPDRRELTDGKTSDIDEVISALETAKEQGVDRVLVNDDGQTRRPRVSVTNNHIGYVSTRPEPDDLHEWVEL